jgi:CPA1 family monovalent cation:H+ antiporter
VIAGIVTGQGAQRWFTPAATLSDEVNWRTVELVLEGGIFLIMGLELDQIVSDVREHEGSRCRRSSRSRARDPPRGAAAYVALILWAGRRRAGRFDRSRLENLDARLDAMSAQGGSATLPASNTDPGTGPGKGKGKGRRSPLRTGRAPHREHARARLARPRRFRLLPLVAARMAPRYGHRLGRHARRRHPRGIPDDPRSIDERPIFIFIAFVVALVSLMLQGFTLPWVVRHLKFDTEADAAGDRDERSGSTRSCAGPPTPPCPPRRSCAATVRHSTPRSSAA